MYHSLFKSPYAIHDGALSKQRGNLRNEQDGELCDVT